LLLPIADAADSSVGRKAARGVLVEGTPEAKRKEMHEIFSMSGEIGDEM